MEQRCLHAAEKTATHPHVSPWVCSTFQGSVPTGVLRQRKETAPSLGGFNELSSLRATVNHHSLPPSWLSTFQLCLHFLSSLFLLLTIHPSNIKVRELGFITRGIRQAGRRTHFLHFLSLPYFLTCKRGQVSWEFFFATTIKAQLGRWDHLKTPHGEIQCMIWARFSYLVGILCSPMKHPGHFAVR